MAAIRIIFFALFLTAVYGGVTKTTITEGDGETHPSVGDTVRVHYVGTLMNGKKFDSSRDRNSPFEFVLGRGRVIKCWDEGIPQLSKGEKANLECSSDYAYGNRGFGSIIPPNSPLNFEVELLGWTSADQ